MLTDARLLNLKPKSKIYKASDRDGMYVTVSPSGTITFRYDYRLHGRRETLTLGRYGLGGVSLAMARELLLDARKAFLKGVARAGEAAREAPDGRHQDLRHGDGHLVGQREVDRLRCAVLAPVPGNSARATGARRCRTNPIRWLPR